MSSSKSKGKRRAEEQKPPLTADPDDDEEGMGEFEDEYGDEFEQEEIYGEEDMDGDEDAKEAIGGDGVNAEVQGRLWRAGDAIPEGEKLDYDSSAYDMLHRLHMEWPCLTFAFAKDNLGEQRTKFPMTAYAVAGTQAELASQNKIVCTKLSQLAKTRHDEDSDSDDDDDDDADEDPIVEAQMVPHEGTVNRLRLMPQSPHICATWAETGKVHIYNLQAPLANLASPGSAPASAVEAAQRPLFTFGGHAEEGYAVDFSHAKAGALATGDNAHKIHVWQPLEGGQWQVRFRIIFFKFVVAAWRRAQAS